MYLNGSNDIYDIYIYDPYIEWSESNIFPSNKTSIETAFQMTNNKNQQVLTICLF